MPRSRKAAEESLETAKRHLGEAEKNIEVCSLDSAVVMAYGDKGIPLDHIKLLDKYRKLRHGVLYRASYGATEREAKEAVSFARKFIEDVEIVVAEENV